MYAIVTERFGDKVVMIISPEQTGSKSAARSRSDRLFPSGWSPTGAVSVVIFGSCPDLGPA